MPYQRGAGDIAVLGLVVRHYYFLWPQPSNKQSQRNLLEIADHGGKIGQNSLNNIAAQCLYVAMPLFQNLLAIILDGRHVYDLWHKVHGFSTVKTSTAQSNKYISTLRPRPTPF